MQIQILRAYELRLLRCTLTPPSSDSPSFPPSASDDTHTILNRILSLIESGNYLDALSSAAAANVVIGEGESPDQVCSDLVRRVEQFVLSNDEEEEGRLCRVILVSCIAVAAFFCFIQCNITGPQDELLPQCPPQFRTSAEWDNWARNHLMSHGSQLLAKFSHLQYLVLAETLIMSSKDLLVQGSLSSECEVRSISWWFARLLLTEQRILDELSSSLFDLLQVNMATTLNHFGSLEQVKDYWDPNLHHEEALDIVSMVHLEAGTMEYTYGRVDSCREKFRLAEAASGLQLSVTGVLGYRTVHQVEPKAQRVLINEGSSSKNGLLSHSTSPGTQENNHPLENNLLGHPREMLESDILRTPKLLECSDQSGNGAEDDENSGLGDSTPLKAIQQAVVLSWCLLIEISTRHDELQRWDMAPFIEAIDSQPTLFFTLQCFHDLLRVRWESSRSRTKGRALEMMEKLVESVRSPLPGVAHRIPFCYVANIPTIPALQKEYAEILISCGLVGEAIAIFEKLELWDNLIYCYRLLEKKAAAVELIKKRLSEMPDDPRLWCSLGDVTNNDSCYEKALEVSNNKSARAKRSLARSAYNRGDYETSKNLWESAMAMNSLYPDGWFAFGAAALKAGDVDKALVGFTKAVQLDPESGEAWNNIACLHMVKKRSEESFIAFKEAIKFKRDSWQMWENYSHVAMDVGNIHQALEAIQNVLRMSSSKRVDTESFTKLLERVVVDMEERALRKNSVIPAVADGSFTQETCLDSQQGSQSKPELRVELSRETEQLMDVLGKILQQMVKNGSGADVWGLYARWHKIKGDLTMCSEALLKQVRSYQGSDLWKDGERFKKFAHASLELCKVYMEISSSTGSHRELVTAEMHLRNVIKQAESFSGTEEFKDLQACLDEVKTKLQSTRHK